MGLPRPSDEPRRVGCGNGTWSGDDFSTIFKYLSNCGVLDWEGPLLTPFHPIPVVPAMTFVHLVIQEWLTELVLCDPGINEATWGRQKVLATAQRGEGWTRGTQSHQLTIGQKGWQRRGHLNRALSDE